MALTIGDEIITSDRTTHNLTAHGDVRTGHRLWPGGAAAMSLRAGRCAT
jgi:hypothetical protein